MALAIALRRLVAGRRKAESIVYDAPEKSSSPKFSTSASHFFQEKVRWESLRGEL